jgi:tetratricopeptide (TPR) repeat protein
VDSSGLATAAAASSAQLFADFVASALTWSGGPTSVNAGKSVFDEDAAKQAAFEGLVALLTDRLLPPGQGFAALLRQPAQSSVDSVLSNIGDAELGVACKALLRAGLDGLRRVRKPGKAASKAEEFQFGGSEDFSRGLVAVVGSPKGSSVCDFLQSMRAEHESVADSWGASKREFTTENYSLTTTPAQEWQFVFPADVHDYRPRDGGEQTLQRQPLVLHDTKNRLMPHPETAQRYHKCVVQLFPQFRDVELADFLADFDKLNLNVAELVGMRLYTGPMFVFYNTMLRARGQRITWEFPNRYPVSYNAVVAGKFITTIHAISSGILKLGRCQPCVTVYRGAGGFKMPTRLLEADAYGTKGGVELSFMSTTMDPKVAQTYGKDWDSERGLNYVYEMEMDSANRGACLIWLSQYPEEAEILFPPLSSLEVLGRPQWRGAQQYYRFRLTCNQHVETVDDLLRRRKTLHCDMLANFQHELSHSSLPSEWLNLFHIELDKALQTAAHRYNDDSFYRLVLNDALSLKASLERLGTELFRNENVRTQKKVPKRASSSSSPFTNKILTELETALSPRSARSLFTSSSRSRHLAEQSEAAPEHEPQLDRWRLLRLDGDISDPQKRKLDAMFRWADVNANGILSRSEVDDLYQVLGENNQCCDDVWWHEHAHGRSLGSGVEGLTPTEYCTMVGSVDTVDRHFNKLTRAIDLHRLCGANDVHPGVLVIVSKLAAHVHTANDTVLDARRQWLGHDYPATLESMHTVACELHTSGEFSAAETLLTECLTARRSVLGPLHPETLETVAKLGEVYLSLEAPREAQPLIEEAVQGHLATLGVEHPAALRSLSMLSMLNYKQGEYGAALPLSEQCLGVRRRTLGSEHADTLHSINLVGNIHMRLKDFGEAKLLYEECLEIRDRTLGEAHPDTQFTRGCLAFLLMQQKEYRLARPVFEAVVAVQRTTLGLEHPTTMMSIGNLATIHRKLGDSKAAFPLLRHCVDIIKRDLPPAPSSDTTSRYQSAAARPLNDEIDSSPSPELEYGSATPSPRIRKTSSLPVHADSAHSLRSVMELAALHWEQEELTEAADLYRLCLEQAESLNANAKDEGVRQATDKLCAVLEHLGGHEEEAAGLRAQLTQEVIVGSAPMRAQRHGPKLGGLHVDVVD